MDMGLIVALVVIIGGSLLVTSLQYRIKKGLRQRVIDADVAALSQLPAGTQAYRVRGSNGANLRSFYLSKEQLILPKDTYNGLTVPVSMLSKLRYDKRSITFVSKDSTEYTLKHLHPAASESQPIQYNDAWYSAEWNDQDALKQLINTLDSYGIPSEQG